jgi:hypothetical protein
MGEKVAIQEGPLPHDRVSRLEASQPVVDAGAV